MLEELTLYFALFVQLLTPNKMHSNKFISQQPFALESGKSLPAVEIAYCTYGALNGQKDNVIYVCHALTANADVADWWPGTVGSGLIFDTDKYFVVCANVLGSCYGTTGPTSVNPLTGEIYGKDFPLLTIRDLVNAHRLLAAHLQLSSIHLLCGGSMGGQQAQEWAIADAGFIKQLFVIATNPRHSAWGIAFNEAQRMAVESGSLETARAIAMLSYRNYNMYESTQTETEERIENFKAASYQRYQGEKLKKRFDTNAYHLLSRAMDSHHVGRRRGSMEQALAQVKAKTLVIGISSDILFPISEQKFIAANIPGAVFEEIDSPYGHDGFLIETEKISGLLRKYLTI
ncbi:MAG TPA: homoserine O-acetyltransferase [Chitinophagales bacterium]|nr:homoserine O-acetyltransferase [Chitinophagales bacterium]